jgi:hypothetical protein
MSTTAKPAAPRQRVRAKHDGFYNGNRVREGKTFTLLKPEDFSAKWMVRVDDSTPDDLAAQTQPKKKNRVTLAGGASADVDSVI